MPRYYRAARSLLVAAVLAVLTVAPVTTVAAQEPPPSTCALGQPNGAPLTIEGIGATMSAPFHLDGGAYQVDWTMTPSGVARSSLRLVPADGEDILRVKYLVMTGSAAGRFSGQTFAYAVKPGSYALDVDAPGRWSVTFTPIGV